MKARMRFAAIALFAALTACGDEDLDGFQRIGSPQNVVVDGWGDTVITHMLPAGTHELRVTGEISCQLAPTAVRVVIPVDGFTPEAGEAESMYELSDCDPVEFTQKVTYTLDVPGQAFVQIYHPPLYPGEPATSILVKDLLLAVRTVN